MIDSSIYMRVNIMGYPDWYKIKEGYQSYKQIGNSVVVPIISLLANGIINLLNKN